MVIEKADLSRAQRIIKKVTKGITSYHAPKHVLIQDGLAMATDLVTAVAVRVADSGTCVVPTSAFLAAKGPVTITPSGNTTYVGDLSTTVPDASTLSLLPEMLAYVPAHEITIHGWGDALSHITKAADMVDPKTTQVTLLNVCVNSDYAVATDGYRVYIGYFHRCILELTQPVLIPHATASLLGLMGGNRCSLYVSPAAKGRRALLFRNERGEAVRTTMDAGMRYPEVKHLIQQYNPICAIEIALMADDLAALCSDALSACGNDREPVMWMMIDGKARLLAYAKGSSGFLRSWVDCVIVQRDHESGWPCAVVLEPKRVLSVLKSLRRNKTSKTLKTQPQVTLYIGRPDEDRIVRRPVCIPDDSGDYYVMPLLPELGDDTSAEVREIMGASVDKTAAGALR